LAVESTFEFVAAACFFQAGVSDFVFEVEFVLILIL